MASPNALKRTYAEAGLENAVIESVEQIVIPTSILPPVSPRSLEHSGAIQDSSALDPPTPTKPTTKKSKLTFAEKETRRIEKEFKEQQKAEEKSKKDEEKARKEEEKAKKAEEKRVKDAEKEERRKVKEQQNKMREEEKARKEEEKNKKAKSQLRLNAFFGQPSLPNSSSNNSPTREGPSPSSSRRSSIAEVDAIEPERRSRSLTPRKRQLPDYERCFPSFFIQSHTSLAPGSRFVRDEHGRSIAIATMDEALRDESRKLKPQGPFIPHTLLRVSPPKRRRRPHSTLSVKDIVAEIYESAYKPIDLTSGKNSTQNPTLLLKKVPMKFLKFAEDVRPPYIGTYTNLHNAQTITKLSRNPFSRKLPDTDYDYDSEAEWEDLGEGEDLDSEGEEEGEDDEEDELDGFLDDEETNDARAIKRRPLLGDLEPMCTGICWEGHSSNSDLSSYCIDILMENPSFPIDPYATTYWAPTPASSTQPKARTQPHLNPNRLPLSPLTRTNALPPPSSLSTQTSQMKPPKPPKRFLPPDELPAFKVAVQGSDLTKIGLIELLKKQFPKHSKDVIKDTLELVADRAGGKLAERRWVLK